MNLNDLVPKDKFDIDSAQRAISAGYPIINPILPKLLTWIQDLNWPVAQKLVPFLATIGEPLESEVRKILEGHDEMWKYWTMKEVISKSAPLRAKLKVELLRLSEHPTESERNNEVDLIAKDILKFQDNAAYPAA